MRMLKEHIVVKVPSIFIDESRYTGVDDRKIIMFVYQNPEQHVRNYGIVVSVPLSLPPLPMIPQYVGAPGYHERPRVAYKKVSDIKQQIQVGDKVYFHWNCLLPDKNTGSGSAYNKQYLFSEPEMVNGQQVTYHYFRVKYELIHAAVRYHVANKLSKPFEWYMEDRLKPITSTAYGPTMSTMHVYTENGQDHVYEKEVQMIGSWVFIEPDMESWDDILIPVPETIGGRPLLDENGQVKLKPKDQWLATKVQPTEKYLRGWIKYVGSPLHGDEATFSEGMYVFFRPKADTKTDFEGKPYFRMYQRNIVAYDPLKARAIA